jgi:hypothetical protein
MQRHLKKLMLRPRTLNRNIQPRPFLAIFISYSKITFSGRSSIPKATILRHNSFRQESQYLDCHGSKYGLSGVLPRCVLVSSSIFTGQQNHDSPGRYSEHDNHKDRFQGTDHAVMDHDSLQYIICPCNAARLQPVYYDGPLINILAEIGQASKP